MGGMMAGGVLSAAAIGRAVATGGVGLGFGARPLPPPANASATAAAASAPTVEAAAAAAAGTASAEVDLDGAAPKRPQLRALHDVAAARLASLAEAEQPGSGQGSGGEAPSAHASARPELHPGGVHGVHRLTSLSPPPRSGGSLSPTTHAQREGASALYGSFGSLGDDDFLDFDDDLIAACETASDSAGSSDAFQPENPGSGGGGGGGGVRLAPAHAPATHGGGAAAMAANPFFAIPFFQQMQMQQLQIQQMQMQQGSTGSRPQSGAASCGAGDPGLTVEQQAQQAFAAFVMQNMAMQGGQGLGMGQHSAAQHQASAVAQAQTQVQAQAQAAADARLSERLARAEAEAVELRSRVARLESANAELATRNDVLVAVLQAERGGGVGGGGGNGATPDAGATLGTVVSTPSTRWLDDGSTSDAVEGPGRVTRSPGGSGYACSGAKGSLTERGVELHRRGGGWNLGGASASASASASSSIDAGSVPTASPSSFDSFVSSAAAAAASMATVEAAAAAVAAAAVAAAASAGEAGGGGTPGGTPRGAKRRPSRALSQDPDVLAEGNGHRPRSRAPSDSADLDHGGPGRWLLDGPGVSGGRGGRGTPTGSLTGRLTGSEDRGRSHDSRDSSLSSRASDAGSRGRPATRGFTHERAARRRWSDIAEHCQLLENSPAAVAAASAQVAAVGSASGDYLDRGLVEKCEDDIDLPMGGHADAQAHAAVAGAVAHEAGVFGGRPQKPPRPDSSSPPPPRLLERTPSRRTLL